MKDEEIRYADISTRNVVVMKNDEPREIRPYQQNAKDEIFRSWDEVDHVMLQMPTGTGKTFLFSSIIQDITRWSEATRTPTKILVIAHRKELIDQIDESLGVFEVSHTVFRGRKEQRNIAKRVLVSSIQTITHPANEVDALRLQDRIRFVIIDEAHHAMADTYRRLWKMFPKARFLGVTATPWRMNHSGFRKLFDRLILTPPVKSFIKMGYLAPYEYYSLKDNCHVLHVINSIPIRERFGDYQESDMLRAMNVGNIRAQLVASYQRFARGKKGIIYSINKKHSQSICEDFRRIGVRIVDIDDSTPKAERAQYVKDFAAGKIDIIVNVNIFSEGFDCPDIEFIQLARPTRSLSMYIQQVGRGLRTSGGKEKCMILDNVGMYSRFGLPDANRHWRAHFNGQDVDESPKGAGGGGWGFYEEPDLSEGNEEMFLIQQPEIKAAPGSDADEAVEVFTPDDVAAKTPAPEKEVSTPAPASAPAPKPNLRKIPARKVNAPLLSSDTFDESRFCIIADSSYYYIKVMASGNCYFLCPVVRKPQGDDRLAVSSDEELTITHYVSEIDSTQKVGTIRIEDSIIHFTLDSRGRTRTTSFAVE